MANSLDGNGRSNELDEITRFSALFTTLAQGSISSIGITDKAFVFDTTGSKNLHIERVGREIKASQPSFMKTTM
jgi:hypothetical protein